MTEAESENRIFKFLAILKLILLLLIIAGIPAFLYFRYGSVIFTENIASDIVEYLKMNIHTAFLIIIGLQILQVVICVIPGQPIQFASSYIFGVGIGFALSITGAVIGTVIAYFLAKVLGSGAMHLFFNENTLNEYQRRLNSGRGLLLAFLIYLIPGVPKDLVSYAAGISEMRFLPFLLISTLGRSPGMIASLLLGHFFGKRDLRAIIILSVTILLILIVCIIKRSALISFFDRIEAVGTESGEKSDV